MKIRKRIYIIIGSLLVLLNVLVDLDDIRELAAKAAEGNFAFLFGANLFLIVGFIMLRAAYKLHKRIQEKELQMLVDEIGQQA